MNEAWKYACAFIFAKKMVSMKKNINRRDLDYNDLLYLMSMFNLPSSL